MSSQVAAEYISTYEKESQKILDYQINAIRMKDAGMFDPTPEEVLGKMPEQKQMECEMNFNDDFTYTDETVACWMKYTQQVGIDNVVKGQLFPSLKFGGRAVSSLYSPIAKHNNFITAAAVTLYKIDKGRLPEKLDDLVPEYVEKVPEDAFDNFKPIKYVKKQNGYLIYSLGLDRIDQKGVVFCGFEGKDKECDIALLVGQ